MRQSGNAHSVGESQQQLPQGALPARRLRPTERSRIGPGPPDAASLPGRPTPHETCADCSALESRASCEQIHQGSTRRRRVATGRRCGRLLYIGLDHLERVQTLRRQRQIYARPRDRWPSGVPRWHDSHSSGSSGQWSASCLRRRGPGRLGSMSVVYGPAMARNRDLGSATAMLYNARM